MEVTPVNTGTVLLGVIFGLVGGGLGVLLLAIFAPQRVADPNRAKLGGIIALALGIVILSVIVKR